MFVVVSYAWRLFSISCCVGVDFTSFVLFGEAYAFYTKTGPFCAL